MRNTRFIGILCVLFFGAGMRVTGDKCAKFVTQN